VDRVLNPGPLGFPLLLTEDSTQILLWLPYDKLFSAPNQLFLSPPDPSVPRAIRVRHHSSSSGRAEPDLTAQCSREAAKDFRCVR